MAEVEPEPVVAEVEPEPEPVVAEVEPEPVVAEVEPEPEPEPVAAAVEPEPEPAPTPVAAPRIAPVSETILHFPQQAPTPPPAETAPAAAQIDTPELAARRAQLDLLGLGDRGEGAVQAEPAAILPYRSRGAAGKPGRDRRSHGTQRQLLGGFGPRGRQRRRQRRRPELRPVRSVAFGNRALLPAMRNPSGAARLIRAQPRP